MSKVASTVVGIVVVAGVAWAGTAWYTGTRVEAELVKSIEQANAQLAEAAPEWRASISLASFEKGVFSSNARYRVILPTTAAMSGAPAEPGAAPQTQEIIIADRIDHGPFPLSRIRAGGLTPVMATSNFELERTESVSAWFDLTQGVSPLSGLASLGYGGAVDGRITFEPVEYQSATDAVKFSGLTLDFDVNADRSQSKVDGDIDLLSFRTLDENQQPTTFEGKSIALTSNMRTMLVGKNDVTIKEITIAAPGTDVHVQDYAQRMDLNEADGKVSGTVAYEAGQIRVDGADLASGQFVVRVANLDAAAVQRLSEQYRAMAVRAAQNPDEEYEATEAEQEAFMEAVLQSLDSNPSLSIDPFQVKTAHGEGQFTLKVDLRKPQNPDMTLDSITAQMIRQLDARLVLAKPMLADLLAFQAISAGAPAETARQQASQQSELIGTMGQQFGAARVEGQNIVSTLSYRDGQVDFNGKKMPVEDFLGSLVSLALGGGMPLR